MIGRAGAEAIADQPVFPTEKAEIAVRDDQVAEARHRADGAVAIEDLGHPLHVRLEANRLAVAAALDPHALRRVVRHSEPPCPAGSETGRASWRDRVCQYVTISVVAVLFTTNNTKS